MANVIKEDEMQCDDCKAIIKEVDCETHHCEPLEVEPETEEDEEDEEDDYLESIPTVWDRNH